MATATKERERDLSSVENVVDYYRLFLGQKVAVLCVRFQYRGIVSVVTPECLILSQATAVEDSGESMRETPEREDPIGGDICIKLDAIEIFYQPRWANAVLPGEEGATIQPRPRRR